MATKFTRRIKPLLDRVLVQKIKPAKKSVGGIMLPESAQTTKNEGLVIACGPGKTTDKGELIAMALKENQKVLLPQYGGTELTFDEEEFVLLKEQEVLAVLDD
jgi:chaperonin GroES